MRYRIAAAILIFVIAAVWLGSSVSPLREEISDYLAGDGAYEVAFDSKASACVQQFRPQHGYLAQVGFVVDWQQDVFQMNPDPNAGDDGGVTMEIADTGGVILKTMDIPAKQLEHGSYTNVDVDIDLRREKIYELRLISHMKSDTEPVLLVCGKEYKLAENRVLTGEQIPENVQLVARYHYENALAVARYLKALALLALAAAGIAVGLPRQRRIRQAVAVCLLIAGPILLGRQLELLLPTNVMLPHAMKWNISLMYFGELLVLLFTHSGCFTIVFCNVLLTVLYSANYFVYIFRGTYLKANELTAVRTAAEVVGQYHFWPTADMMICFCILAVFVSWGAQTGTWKCRRAENGADMPEVVSPSTGTRKILWRAFSYIATIAAAVILWLCAGHYLLDTDFLLEHGFDYYSGINQEYTYYFDGYLVGSLLNIKYNRIRPPEGYSVKRVEEILEESMQAGQAQQSASRVGGDEELPHIILIMNESFSDLRVNGNLQLSAENLSVYQSLRENAVKGYVNASVLGGGTANSEFEVFTGCAMAFLPDSYYAYEQAVVGPMDSMISNLKEKGYSTYAMHPEKATNWRRNVVYPYLGFEHMLWKEDFAGAEVIHSGVSDAETFRKVEEIFENRAEGEKLFVFDLTMQNHGYYLKSNVERTVRAVNVDSEEADIYLSLVYESDRAFGDLVDYFKKQDEKVIICMFGDHQPKFEGDSFYEDVYSQTEALSEIDKKRNLYKTPFVIWANYDIEEAEGLDISMSSLGILLQRTAGVGLTPYECFLEKEFGEYPVITVNGYVDRNGVYNNWTGDGTEFPEYRMLQYNYLFDADTVEWGY